MNGGGKTEIGPAWGGAGSTNQEFSLRCIEFETCIRRLGGDSNQGIRCSEEKPKPDISSEGGFKVIDLHEIILEDECGQKNKCGIRTNPWTL